LFIGVEIGEEHVDGETDEAVEPANDTSEHEKLSITGEVTAKSNFLNGVCPTELLYLLWFDVIQFEGVLVGLRDGVFDVRRFLTDDVKVEMRRKVGTDGEGKHGYEPLDAAEETAGLLQDLQV